MKKVINSCRNLFLKRDLHANPTSANLFFAIFFALSITASLANQPHVIFFKVAAVSSTPVLRHNLKNNNYFIFPFCYPC